MENKWGDIPALCPSCQWHGRLGNCMMTPGEPLECPKCETAVLVKATVHFPDGDQMEIDVPFTISL